MTDIELLYKLQNLLEDLPHINEDLLESDKEGLGTWTNQISIVEAHRKDNSLTIKLEKGEKFKLSIEKL